MIALFESSHHPVTPAIPCLCTYVFNTEIATFKLLKSCLTFLIDIAYSPYDSTSKWWLYTAFFFWIDKKSNVWCKHSFSGTNIDMITKRYNTDIIVWQTQLVRACRLMSGEQTDIVSNSYATYYAVRLSLKKTIKGLCIHHIYCRICLLLWVKNNV